MDKQKFVKAVLEHLERDLAVLQEAARATYEAATHEESKPENEYDTRGLEASYLAGAQAKRAAEIEAMITTFKFVKIRAFTPDEAISSTALVEVDLDGKRSHIFVMSKGGGLTLQFEGRSIQVVTPSSPLGEAVLGLHAGDVALVEIGAQTREYEIISIE